MDQVRSLEDRVNEKIARLAQGISNFQIPQRKKGNNNMLITINVSVANGTDLHELRERVKKQIDLLSNDKREDQGITRVYSVQISGR